MNKNKKMWLLLGCLLLSGCPHLDGCRLGDGAYQTLCWYDSNDQLLWGN